MKRSFAGLVLAAAVALSGCADKSSLEARSLAQWKAYCAAKGKQFLWNDTSDEQGVFLETVQVEGRCVGPGERGYEVPAPADSEP